MLTMFLIFLGLFAFFGLCSVTIMVKWLEKKLGRYLFLFTSTLTLISFVGMFYTFLEDLY